MSIKKIDISKIIGEAVKTARKNKGLTLKALAELVGTSAGHLSEIEKNKVKKASAKATKKIQPSVIPAIEPGGVER